MTTTAITGAFERVRRWVEELDPAASTMDPPVGPEEAMVEGKLRSRRGASRPNTIAVLSPKGGVGKTTCAFVLGNVLASHVNQRVVVVDATTELGTLTALVPEELRSEGTSIDLMRDAKQIANAAAIRPYMSCLPSGLHLLAAPPDPETAGSMMPEHYQGLVQLLSVFYEVVILDLDTGLSGAPARFARGAADQLVLVTTPDSLTAGAVLGSLDRLPGERTTILLNMAQPGTAWDQEPVEQRFREQRVYETATLPFDERLLEALDNRTYDLGAIGAEARVAIMRLGVRVANRLS